MNEEEWTGKLERPLRVWQNPRLSDDIYLHFSELLKAVKHYAPSIKGRVLDVGAGKAPYRKFMRNASEYIKLDNHLYEGIDVSADITKKTPFSAESFDSVVCFQVLEHISEPRKAIDEIHRLLRKGGTCLLTTHLAAPLHGEPYDYYRFTPYALKDLFRDFSHVEIKPNGGASLSIIQFIVWGVSEKIPKIFSLPIIFSLNLLGKAADKLFYNKSLTINYSVFAIK